MEKILIFGILHFDNFCKSVMTIIDLQNLYLQSKQFIISMLNTFDYLFKYILIGDSSVGKSCLLNRFIEGKFKSQHDPTLGVEFGCKNITVKGMALKIQIWDTAGQQSFKSITRSYYKGSVAAFLVFDVTKRDSFENLQKWLIQIRNYAHKHIHIVLIGNKSDLSDKRQISRQQATKYAQQKNFQYYETSALNGAGIEDSFKGITTTILQKIQSKEIDPQSEDSRGIKCGKKKKDLTKSSTMQISHSDSKREKSQNCKC